MAEEPTIVAASMQASGTGTLGPRDASLAKRIEKAMTHAVLDALAEGIDINDSEEILRRKQAARQVVVDEHHGIRS